jgi:hypothetical protein
MGVGISIDPTGIVEGAFDLSGNQKRADRAFSFNQAQSFRDERFRIDERDYSRQWAREERQRQDTRLQRLKADAEKAGIGINAALGIGGSAPVNIQFPRAQGGRAMGTYQRQSPVEGLMTFQLQQQAKKSKYESDSEESRAELLRWQAALAQDEFYIQRAKHMGLISSDPNFYIRVHDNYSEAVDWISQGYQVTVNPELNMDLPETVGAYYHFKPRAFSPREVQPIPFTKHLLGAP